MTFPSYNSRQPYTTTKIIEKPTIVAKRQIVQIHWGLSRLSFLYTNSELTFLDPLYRVNLPFIYIL